MTDAGKVQLEVETNFKGATKPGVKTTEFWKSIGVHIIATLVIAYGMWKGSDGIAQFGAVLMAITQGSYNIGRAFEKGKAHEATGLLGGGQ